MKSLWIHRRVFGEVWFTCKLLRIYSYIYASFMNEAQCYDVMLRNYVNWDFSYNSQFKRARGAEFSFNPNQTHLIQLIKCLSGFSENYMVYVLEQDYGSTGTEFCTPALGRFEVINYIAITHWQCTTQGFQLCTSFEESDVNRCKVLF